MNNFKFINKRRINSLRLKDYDYSFAGAYFITICTKNREHSFGKIINGKLQTTEQIKICTKCWLDLPNHYNNCMVDEFIIMPDHVHGIIIVKNNDYKRDNYSECFSRCRRVPVGAGLKPAPTHAKPAPTQVERGYNNVQFIAINEILINKQFKPCPVSEIIRGFKTFTARKINDWQNTPGQPFWQSRFHDHIIRNEYELNRIRKYIINNPSKWEKDRNNLKNHYM